MEHNYTPFPFFKWNTIHVPKVCLLLLISAALLPGSIYSQQSYTFTTASATGSLGPSQSQINTAYASTNLNSSVTVTGGIQSWTVPVSGGYRIEARGAQGGGAQGGRGAIMAGDFTLTAGQVLKILVGQAGQSLASDVNISGGGGSYVVVGNNTIMVIAGGGGGARSVYASSNGTISLNGQDGQTGTSTIDGAGGTGGNGGGGSSCRGGGGAGWLSNGGAGNCSTTGAGMGGIMFTAGGFGGGITATGIVGGFGGGGSSEGVNTAWTYAGGGGGYSGGGGASIGDATPRGGGGGSINNGINQTNAAGANLGDGRVIITELCSIKIYASGTNSLNPSLCSGNSLTLTTTAVSNYTWSNGNTTSTAIVVSPGSTTTYSVIGTSSLSCVAAAVITVTVSSGLPVLTITNTPNNICLGKTATLTAGGALTYTWTSGIINGQTFTPTATSSYTVSGENGCGISTETTVLTVAPLSVSVLASPTLVCSGTTTTLSATSSVNGYTWQPTSIPGQSIIVNPTVNTIYTVTASDGTCTGNATLAVFTKPTPTIGVAASTSVICDGESVNLTASGGISYTWMPGNQTGAGITVNPSQPTLYTAVGINSVNCISSANQIILVNPVPTITVASSPTMVCVGGSVTLTTGGANTYTWNTGLQGVSMVVNPTAATVYTVVGTYTATSCSNTQTVMVNVFEPVLSVSPSTVICQGGSANLSASGGNLNSYVWAHNGSQFQSISVSPTVQTTYTVSASTTSNGVTCPSSNTVMVSVNPNPTITIVATRSVMCKKDPNPSMTASGAANYTWTPSIGNVSLSVASVTVAPSITTIYSVTGTDANGCKGSAAVTITVNTCSGISEAGNSAKGLYVYPNPNNGTFIIQSDSDLDLRIISELGQEIKVIRLSEQNDRQVSVNDLADGIYFIVAGKDDSFMKQKIVITR